MIFLRVIKALERRNCQIITATHAPMLMAYPGATLLRIDEDGWIRPVDFRRTSHYLLMREFIKNPEDFIGRALED